jgi:hypothetical protein
MGSTLDAPTALQAVGIVEPFDELAAQRIGERPLTAARQATTSAQSAERGAEADGAERF